MNAFAWLLNAPGTVRAKLIGSVELADGDVVADDEDTGEEEDTDGGVDALEL